jgi:GH15 family glucan-1,4-alpha-glucosidase
VRRLPAQTVAVPDAGLPTAFPSIAEYAFLSDSEAMALVAPSGDVEWMCVPRPDSPSVFGALLDRDAGSFRVGPTNVAVPSGRRYLPGTIVLETTWMTRSGWVVVSDALVVGPWHHEEERSRTHRRVPTDNDAAHVLVRMVRCVHGSVELQVECEPVLDYGREPAAWEFLGDGYGLAAARARGSELELRLATDLPLGLEGGRARARMTLREGERAFAALGWSEHPLPGSFEEADAALTRTARYWREWLAGGRFPDHPWREYLQRSALTLRGLIFSPSGAMLAAATTSLPETPGGERNWDYRYAWIRDSTFGLWGLYTLGFDAEANDFFYFAATSRRARRTCR